MTAFRGPFDPHRGLLEWELDRWVEERCTRELTPGQRRAQAPRPQGLGLLVLAPALAIGILVLNAPLIYWL